MNVQCISILFPETLGMFISKDVFSKERVSERNKADRVIIVIDFLCARCKHTNNLGFLINMHLISLLETS